MNLLPVSSGHPGCNIPQDSYLRRYLEIACKNVTSLCYSGLAAFSLQK